MGGGGGGGGDLIHQKIVRDILHETCYVPYYPAYRRTHF